MRSLLRLTAAASGYASAPRRCTALLRLGLTAAALAASALPSCKSGGPDEAAADQVQPNAARDDMTKVPPSLWSPAQRRSTAGYLFLVSEYMAMKERDAKNALPVLEAAYGLDPNPFLGGKMLMAKAAAGSRPEALLEARKMVLLYPADAKLHYFYGELLADSEEFEAAAQAFERSLALDPNYEVAYLQLTQVYQAQKDPAKAIVVAKDLVKHVPSSVAGWSQLSRLYLMENRPKEALVPARRAWEMQSNNPNLIQVYAIALQMNGKTKQAVAMYEQLYRLDPSDDQLTARMIELYRELGNLESALELLDGMAKETGPARPAIQMQRALLLWELKRNDEAAALLKTLAQENPESDRVKYLAGYGQERINRHDEAVTYYKSIPEASTLRPDADFRVLVILKEQKDTAGALAMGRKMLDSPRATWETYGLVSGVYADAERYDDAVQTVDDGFAKFPDKPRLLFLRGVYQEKAGDRDACIKTMREVIAKDPEGSSAYNFLGYLYAERGENLDEAEKLVQRALQLKPNDGFYLDSLGWVYYQKANYKLALATLEKAGRIEPKEGVIFEHISDVHVKLGSRAAAIAALETALKGSLEPKDKERIKKKLQDLQGKRP